MKIFDSIKKALTKSIHTPLNDEFSRCKINDNTDNFCLNLTAAFKILSHGDEAVMSKINDCLSDTAVYYQSHQDDFEARGLNYAPDGEKWLQLIAAVDAMEHAGYLAELDWKEEACEFESALADLLAANDIEFSLDKINFSPEKDIPNRTAQFNEYAGQSGITIYYIDIDSDSYVLGAAEISDYAEAADIAAAEGINISCRLK